MLIDHDISWKSNCVSEKMGLCGFSTTQVRCLGVVLLRVYYELINMFLTYTFYIPKVAEITPMIVRTYLCLLHITGINTINYWIRFPTKTSLLLGADKPHAPSLPSMKNQPICHKVLISWRKWHTGLQNFFTVLLLGGDAFSRNQNPWNRNQLKKLESESIYLFGWNLIMACKNAWGFLYGHAISALDSFPFCLGIGI